MERLVQSSPLKHLDGEKLLSHRVAMLIHFYRGEERRRSVIPLCALIEEHSGLALSSRQNVLFWWCNASCQTKALLLCACPIKTTVIVVHMY